MSNRWALLIGVNDYHESLGALKYCTNDANLMHETLTSEACSFPDDNVLILTDHQEKERQPTFGNIHSWLGTWLSQPGPEDLVLIYFAGHGREANGQALLAPLDATLESLPVTGIPISYLNDMLGRCKARQKVLILDTCHSGAGRDVATMSTNFRDALDVGEGSYTIASCDADQISYEWPEKKQGVFTYFLVEALRHGASVESDGRVLLDSVYDSVRNNILAWTTGKRLKQEPVRISRVKGDIHIATRTLSVEQQLKAAQSQLVTLHETIAELRSETKQLKTKNTALEKSEKESRRQVDSPANSARSNLARLKRRQIACYVACLASFGCVLIALLPERVHNSLLASLSLGLASVSLLALIIMFIYTKLKDFENFGDTGFQIFLATCFLFPVPAAIGTSIATTLDHTPSFILDIPGARLAITSPYSNRYDTAQRLKKIGDIEAAFQETLSLVRDLQFKDSQILKDIKWQALEFKQLIVSEYGPSIKVWEDGGRIVVWNESTKSAKTIATFSNVKNWIPSPNGKKIAFMVDSGMQVFLVNADGTDLKAFNSRSKEPGYYESIGWKDDTTLTIKK